MRYVTFVTNGAPRERRLGVMNGDRAIDLEAARAWAQEIHSLAAEPLPLTLMELVLAGPPAWAYTQALVSAVAAEDPGQLQSAGRMKVSWGMEEIRLLPPLARPMGLRDFYAFEQHVSAAFANRGQEVPEAWYRMPAFYFSNPHSVYGPDETIPYPAYSQALDFELEVACVIGQAGRNIPADRASAFIFGYMIFNDWSARDVQRVEATVGLGPAKAKDFASSFGPYLVTPDEFDDRRTDRPGVFNLAMTASINGQTQSKGNWRDLYYSFGQMIERASDEVFLLPGEVLGSGTVGSGCLQELTKGQGPWLRPGDVVELEIERMGVLRNPIGPPSRSGS
jgi:fumarylacetoacetate (FAA) hydrolase